jgi:hypothetical protein
MKPLDFFDGSALSTVVASRIVRSSADAVVGVVGMHGKLRQIQYVGGASNLGVWVDCQTLPKGACDM